MAGWNAGLKKRVRYMYQPKAFMRWVRLWAAGGVTLLLGGCGLSDQQLAGVFQSVLATGLNTLVATVIEAVVGGATGGA
jgi:hypothetical protein